MDYERIESTPEPARHGDTKPAMIIYILYLAAALTAFPLFIGVVMAYVFRDGAPDWLATHYRYQIRTFWISCVWTIIGTLLLIILIGKLVLLLLVVWMVARSLVGWRALSENRPISNPTTWLV